jgi:hypothetical protein
VRAGSRHSPRTERFTVLSKGAVPTVIMARWARRVERSCRTFVTYLPLAFVYGLTTWAVWVVVSIGATTVGGTWIGTQRSTLGSFLGHLPLLHPKNTMNQLTRAPAMHRHNVVRRRCYPLPPAQLVLHDSRVYETRLHDQ